MPSPTLLDQESWSGVLGIYTLWVCSNYRLAAFVVASECLCGIASESKVEGYKLKYLTEQTSRMVMKSSAAFGRSRMHFSTWKLVVESCFCSTRRAPTRGLDQLPFSIDVVISNLNKLSKSDFKLFWSTFLKLLHSVFYWFFVGVGRISRFVTATPLSSGDAMHLETTDHESQ